MKTIIVLLLALCSGATPTQAAVKPPNILFIVADDEYTLGTFCALLCVLCGRVHAGERPNLRFILADDFGWGARRFIELINHRHQHFNCEMDAAQRTQP